MQKGEQGGHTGVPSTPDLSKSVPPRRPFPKNIRTFSGSPRAACSTDSHAKMQHLDLSLAMRIGLLDPLTGRSDGRRLIRNRLVFRAPSSVFFYRSLLPVGAGDLSQVAPDALIDLPQTALQLGLGEILIPVIRRLELAAVDGDEGIGEKCQLVTQHDELTAHQANGLAMVHMEVGDGFEVRGTGDDSRGTIWFRVDSRCGQNRSEKSAGPATGG